jgi:hypothetical protein
MTEVDRYNFRSKQHGTEVVVKSHEGKWVRASDYDALTAERYEAINQLDSAIHSQIVLEKRIAAVMEDRKLILEERDRTFALMLARAERAEADNARLRKALTVASRALDDAGDQLNELADALSREPRAAFSAYKSARIAAALTGKETK